MPPVFVVNEIGYSLGLYDMSSKKIIGIRFLHLPIEDIIFGLLSAIIVPLITIIMYHGYQNNRRFRKIYFVKNGEYINRK